MSFFGLGGSLTGITRSRHEELEDASVQHYAITIIRRADFSVPALVFRKQMDERRKSSLRGTIWQVIGNKNSYPLEPFWHLFDGFRFDRAIAEDRDERQQYKRSVRHCFRAQKGCS